MTTAEPARADYRIEYRKALLGGLLRKGGWYIVTADRAEGPFDTRELAGDIAFHDRHYG